MIINLNKISMSFTLNDQQYTYIRLLGKGGYNDTHLVKDQNGNLYAIKASRQFPDDVIADMQADDPNFNGPYTASDLIDGEIVTLEKLRYTLKGKCHPNIVCYYDSGILRNDQVPVQMRNDYNEDVHLIVEQYINGQSLDELIKNNEKINTFKLIEDLLSALYTLEQANIFYPDLSIYNILFNSDTKNFVLIDFSDTENGYNMSQEETSINQVDYLNRFLEMIINPKLGEFISYDEFINMNPNQMNVKDTYPMFQSLITLNKETNANVTQAINNFSKIVEPATVVIRSANGEITYKNGHMNSFSSTIVTPLNRERVFENFRQHKVKLSSRTSDRNLMKLDLALNDYLTSTDISTKQRAAYMLRAFGIPVA